MPSYESILLNRLYFVRMRYAEIVVLIALLEEHPDYAIREIADRLKRELPNVHRSARVLHEKSEREAEKRRLKKHRG